MQRYVFKFDGFEVGEFFLDGKITPFMSMNYKRDFANLHGISMYGLKIEKELRND
jgi:hypothetical protein